MWFGDNGEKCAEGTRVGEGGSVMGMTTMKPKRQRVISHEEFQQRILRKLEASRKGGQAASEMSGEDAAKLSHCVEMLRYYADHGWKERA